MIKKVYDYILKSFSLLKVKIKTTNNPDIIKFIIGYIIFVFSLFLVGWGFLWFVTGLPDLPLLLKGIEALSTPALLAVVKFVTGTAADSFNNFIDRNHNGIDDRLEKKG